VTALLICKNQTTRIGDPFKRAFEQKKRLDGIISASTPVDTIIEQLLQTNEYLYFRLQGGSASAQP
jgi:hypothetical protein